MKNGNTLLVYNTNSKEGLDNLNSFENLIRFNSKLANDLLLKVKETCKENFDKEFIIFKYNNSKVWLTKKQYEKGNRS